MMGPCVRVPREAGEEIRAALAADGLLDESREIVLEDDELYIPVVDGDAIAASYDVVDKELPRRERQTMPADVLGWEPSYERLGEVIIVDEDDPATANQVAQAIMASDLPVKTVLNRQSKICGEKRLREWEVLAGDGTETVHREYGYEYALDITSVYFSPRLATERHRVVEQVARGENGFDLFAGVGPFAIPMADRGATVVATDVNEAAVAYLEDNADRNDVADRLTAIHDDVREVAEDYRGWADRLVMNLPHSADEFLDVATIVAGDDCTLHYYDIQHEDDPFGPGERAIRDAVGDDTDVTVHTRRVVRSYAPHEINVVLDVQLRAE